MKNIICKCGLSTNKYRTLQSTTKGKIITLCENCYKKHSKSLIKGHAYIEVLNHSKDELLNHWCAYNGIHGENKDELFRIINIPIS
jgi:hypothetical protein